MAKHFYHIPLQNALHFIKQHCTALREFASDPKRTNYYAQIGKSRYVLEIEKFIHFFKIDSDIGYALKTLEYFTSKRFVQEMGKHLNFSQFALQSAQVEEKAFFFSFCALYAQTEPKAFEHFIEKTLIHYHNAFHKSANITIDYQGICHIVAKSKRLKLNESFGESEEGAFFRLLIDGETIVDLKGKRIKTLRKKGYKTLLDLLVSWEEARPESHAKDALENLERLKVL